MKITVKQLKQLIREQVEEMSHSGMPEARKPKADFEQGMINDFKKGLKDAYRKAYDLYVKQNPGELDDALRSSMETAALNGEHYTSDHADAVFRDLLGLESLESEETDMHGYPLSGYPEGSARDAAGGLARAVRGGRRSR